MHYLVTTTKLAEKMCVIISFEIQKLSGMHCVKLPFLYAKLEKNQDKDKTNLWVFKNSICFP